MFRKSFFIAVLGLAVMLFCSGNLLAGDEVNIGVLAKRGAKKCLEKWSPTGDYLTEATKTKVNIIPLNFTQIEPAVEKGEIDFVLANSAFYVELQKKHNVHAVASLINSRQGKALTQFGGVVFVKADSPVKTLADIKGKKFMCVKYSSFGGAHMAWRLLLENGINPKTDCAAFIEGKKHDNVVLAVRAGAVDVGMVRTDTMERMAAEGTINMGEFSILNKINDDFPFVHSTRLYPEWPMAACSKTSADTAKAIAKALKEMKPDMPAAQAAKIVGWTDALDYAPVIGCLKAIKYGAFAN